MEDEKETQALQIVSDMFAAVDRPFQEVKICRHPWHSDGATGQGSVTFFVGHKEDDDKCWGCFAEHLDDAFHTALERIWAVLAPIGAENLDDLRSDSAKEVSVVEMLTRARVAWELAEQMLFGGDGSADTKTLEKDQALVLKRAKQLDGPMRKLLENSGKPPQTSHDFAGKTGIVKKLAAIEAEMKKRASHG